VMGALENVNEVFKYMNEREVKGVKLVYEVIKE